LTKLSLVTNAVDPNEACHGCREGPHYCDIHKRNCWIQRIFVERGDRLAYYETDFGDADNFPGIQPLIMPSFGENTVAEMQYWFDKNRHDTYWADYVDELQQSSTLMVDIVEQMQQIEKARLNQSTFGPHQNKQRNDYSVGLNYKRAKERREEETGKRTFYGSS
jgi:hypothetical protein